MSKIFFHYTDKKIGKINETTKIKKFLLEIFVQQKVFIKRVDYIFCSDRQILDINLKFLSHGSYTDIITFSLGKKNLPIESEIYISLERVKENANRYGVSIKEEILRVLFHGILHLCGYKDKTKKEAYSMRAMENRYLRMFKEYKL